MEGNSITSFENLCRIFEMRVKLDKEKGIKTPVDVLENYENYSKKIDSIYNSQFQKELKPLISPAITLEKEEDRLRRLIKLLEERLDRRIELEDRYYNSTGKYISGLQVIISDTELEAKKERLSLVSRYLDTSKEIENITESINKLKDSLLTEEKKKEEYESKNKLMEDELYSSFTKIIKENECYRNINEEDLNSQLDEIRTKVSETKETLDITKESIGSLMTNGLEDDYTSYVEEAERSYYSYKNKELILKIYKLVISFEDDFKLICAKREKIEELLEEKKSLRENLSIDTEDDLFTFEKTLLVQKEALNIEKEILENITNYNSRINFKEERLEELNEVNNSVEILSLLREYGLIETYESDDKYIEVVEDEFNIPEMYKIELPSLDTEESVIEEVYDPYRIVGIKDYPKTLNVGLAKLKGESVREKVNKKLNPKKEETTFDDIAEDSFTEVDRTLPEEQNNDDNTDNASTGTSLELIDNKTLDDSPALDNNKNPLPNSELKVELPVWELPREIEPKEVSFESPEVNLPMWEMIKPLDNIPIEESKQEISSIGITPMEENNNSNDLFWIPVSEAKLETKEFPNLNIPISSNFNGNDNFGFPTINE